MGHLSGHQGSPSVWQSVVQLYFLLPKKIIISVRLKKHYFCLNCYRKTVFSMHTKNILGFAEARARMVRLEEIGPKVAGVGSRWVRRQGGAAVEEIPGDSHSWVSSGRNLLVETRAGRSMRRKREREWIFFFF